MVDELVGRLAPDELWALVEPPFPEFAVRRWVCSGGSTSSVHGCGVRPDQRLCVADAAALVRCHGADGSSPFTAERLTLDDVKMVRDMYAVAYAVSVVTHGGDGNNPSALPRAQVAEFIAKNWDSV